MSTVSGRAGTNAQHKVDQDKKAQMKRIPQTKKEMKDGVTFEGEGRYFIKGKDDKGYEVKLTKENDYRFISYDDVLTEKLREKGFKEISKAQLKKEHKEAMEKNKTNIATNENVEAYTAYYMEENKVFERLEAAEKNIVALTKMVEEQK